MTFLGLTSEYCTFRKNMAQFLHRTCQTIVMRFALTITFVLSIFFGIAQSGVGPKVNAALGKGDVKALQGMMTANVDITVGNKEGIMPADQAAKAFTEFFNTNPPVEFIVKHKGTSKLDALYRIGTLRTKKGDFRVTYFLKKTPNGVKIKQMRIES